MRRGPQRGLAAPRDPAPGGNLLVGRDLAFEGFGAEDLQRAPLAVEADPVQKEALAASRLRAGFLPLVDFLPAVALVMLLLLLEQLFHNE